MGDESLLGVLGEDMAEGDGGFDTGASFVRSTRNEAVPDGRPSHGYAGLWNQGTTCYLNSFLQALYHTPEIRSGLYALTDSELNLSIYEEDEKRIAAEEAVEDAEQKKRKATLADRKKLEDEWRKRKDAASDSSKYFEPVEGHIENLCGMMGLTREQAVVALYKHNNNLDNAVNWLLENASVDWSAQKQPPLKPAATVTTAEDEKEAATRKQWAAEDAAWKEREEAQKKAHEAEEKKRKEAKKGKEVGQVDLKAPRKLLIELRRLFARLQLADNKAVTTDGLTRRGMGWKNARGQQDYMELVMKFLEAFEYQADVTSQKQQLCKFFTFSEVTRRTCTACGDVSETDSVDKQFLVTVKGFRNIVDSIRHKYSFVDKIDGRRCPTCKQTAKPSEGTLALTKLPPMLIVVLQRLDMDMYGNRSKINDYCAYPLVLDMEPFLHGAKPSGAPVTDSKAASSATAAGAATSTATAAASANKSDASASPSSAAASAKKKDKDNKSGGKEEEKVPPLEQPPFNPNSQHLYDLCAAVAHSGGAQGGHYHAFVRDILKEDSDRKQGISNSADVKDKDGQELAPHDREQRWLDCNDSNVRLVLASSLGSLYGGPQSRENAYVLLYRKRVAGVDLPQPVVPEYQRKEVEAENAAIQTARKAYQDEINNITVYLHLPERYLVADGALLSRFAPTDKAKQDENVVEVMVDQRLPPHALLRAIVASDKARAALKLPKDVVIPADGEELPESHPLRAWRFSPLNIEGKAPYSTTLSKAIAFSSKISLEEQGVKSGASGVLVWNGSDIGGAPFSQVAPEEAPVQIVLQVHRPKHAGAGAESKAAESKHSDPADCVDAEFDIDANVAVQDVQFVLKANSPLSRLAAVVEEKTGIPLRSLRAFRVGDKGALIPFALEDAANKTLLQLNLSTGLTLAVESDTDSLPAGASVRVLSDAAVDALPSLSSLPASLLVPRPGSAPPLSGKRRVFATQPWKDDELAQLAPLLRFLHATSVLPARFRVAPNAFRVGWRSFSVSATASEVRNSEDNKAPVDSAWLVSSAAAAAGSANNYHEITFGANGAPQQTPCKEPALLAPKDWLLAERVQLANRTRLRLDIILAAEAKAQPRRMNVSALMTVAGLLAKAVQDLPSAINPPDTLWRLRRGIGILPTLRPGGLLLQPLATLEQAMIVNDTTLILEKGPMPLPNQLDVFVTINLKGEGKNKHCLADMVPYLLDSKHTIKQCKKAILTHFGLTKKEDEFTLSRASGWGEQGKVFTNEYVTLQTVKAAHGEAFWLEEEKLPIKGAVDLQVFLHMPSLPASLLPLALATSASLETKDEKKGGPGPAAAPSAGAAAAVPALESKGGDKPGPAPAAAAATGAVIMPLSTAEAGGNRSKNFLQPMMRIQFSSQLTLRDLKLALHSNSETVLGQVPSPSHIRIRGMTRSDDLARIVAADDVPLAKQGLNTDRKIAVQLLSEPEEGLSDKAMILFVCRSSPTDRSFPPEKKAGGPETPAAADGAAAAPATAPSDAPTTKDGKPVLKHPKFTNLNEVVFDGSRVADLQKRLGQHYKLPPEQVGAVKWVAQTRRWRLIRKDGPPADSPYLIEEKKAEEERKAIMDVVRTADKADKAAKKAEKAAIAESAAMAGKGNNSGGNNKQNNKGNSGLESKGNEGGGGKQSRKERRKNQGGDAADSAADAKQSPPSDAGQQTERPQGNQQAQKQGQGKQGGNKQQQGGNKQQGGGGKQQNQSPSTKGDSGKGGAAADGEVNLLQKPYQLHDSDIVTVFDLKDWSGDVDVFYDWPLPPGVQPLPEGYDPSKNANSAVSTYRSVEEGVPEIDY